MTKQVVFGVVSPLVIAGAIVFSTFRSKPRDDGSDRFAWRIPIALAAPVILAFLVLYGWPKEQWSHMMFVACAGMVVGVAYAIARRSIWLKTPLIACLAVLVTWSIWPVIERENWVYRLAAGLSTVVLFVGLQPLAARRSGFSLHLAVTVVVAAASGLILMSGFLKLAVPIGALAAACGALAVASAFMGRRAALAEGGVAVVGSMLAAALTVAWLYYLSIADAMPVWVFAVIAFAPLAAWIAEIPPLPKYRLFSAVLRVLFVSVVCAGALWFAHSAEETAASDDPYADMYEQMLRGQ